MKISFVALTTTYRQERKGSDALIVDPEGARMESKTTSRQPSKSRYAPLLAVMIALVSLLGFGVVTADSSFAATNCSDPFDPNFQSPECTAAPRAASHDVFNQIFGSMNRDAFWFWTGRVNGQSVEADAATRAGAAGGYSLETRLAEQNISMPGFDTRDAASVALWEDASRTYANRAEGVVRVLKGTEVRTDSVWETIEFPTLQKNVQVDRVVAIDAATGAETVIYEQDGEL